VAAGRTRPARQSKAAREDRGRRGPGPPALEAIEAAFTDSTIRRFGIGLLAAKFILVPLVFDPSGLNAFSVPKAVTGQVLGALLLGVLLSLLARFRRAMWRPAPVHAAVGVLLGTYVAATLVALNLPVALIGSPENAVGLFALLDGIVLFLGLGMLVRTPMDAWVLGVALFVPVLPVVSYELIQWTGKDPIAWVTPGTVRPFSTFGNPDLLAPYLGTTTSAAGALSIAAERNVGRRYRSLAALIAIFGLAGTLLTGSRAAVVGFGLVAVLAAIVILHAKIRGQRRGVPVALTLGLVAASVTIALSPVGQRFVGLAASVIRAEEGVPIEGSVGGRLVLYQAAATQIQERPVFGVGPDNFTAAFPRTRPEDAFKVLKTNAIETATHDWVLKVGTDAGILGLFAFIATLVAGVLAALSSRGTSWISWPALASAVYLLGTGLFSPNDAGTDWLYWAALGVIASANDGRGQKVTRPTVAGSRSHRGRPQGRSVAALSSVPLGFGLLLASLLLPALEANRAAGENRALRLSGSVPASIVAGERATARASYRAEYWHGLGLSFAAMKDYAKAERSFSKAVELASYHTTYLTNLARAQLGLGLAGDRSKMAAALETARQAIRNDPNNGDAHVTLSIVGQASGHPEETVTASERALSLGFGSSDPAFYLLTGRAYLQLDRPADAERLLRSGIAVPTDPQMWASLELELARALVRQQRNAEAIAEIEKILAAIPGHRGAQELRRDLEPP